MTGVAQNQTHFNKTNFDESLDFPFPLDELLFVFEERKFEFQIFQFHANSNMMFMTSEIDISSEIC